jgi:hypothetical protein
MNLILTISTGSVCVEIFDEGEGRELQELYYYIAVGHVLVPYAFILIHQLLDDLVSYGQSYKGVRSDVMAVFRCFRLPAYSGECDRA